MPAFACLHPRRDATGRIACIYVFKPPSGFYRALCLLTVSKFHRNLETEYCFRIHLKQTWFVNKDSLLRQRRQVRSLTTRLDLTGSYCPLGRIAHSCLNPRRDVTGHVARLTYLNPRRDATGRNARPACLNPRRDAPGRNACLYVFKPPSGYYTSSLGS